MPYVTSGGVRLYYEEAGRGTPILFAHEFSGDLRSWEAQMQHFSRTHRCIAFNARGYPPSDVPERISDYSPRQAVEDMVAVLKHLGIARAHIFGCSMGAQTTLHFGLDHPRRALTLTAIGAGSGSTGTRAQMKERAAANARRYEEEGLEAVLETVRRAPNRVQLQRKNPRAFDDFGRRFLEHSAQGCAYTQRGIQAKRPSLMTLGAKFKALKVPTHLIAGDEDPAAVEASLFVKRTCATARLTILPATGHLAHNEEPEIVHRLTEKFYAEVAR